MGLQFPEAQIIVFAKAPLPGQVKTRLIPHLGKPAATALHKQLAQLSISAAVAARLCPVHLWCSPSTRHPFFTACLSQFGVKLRLQRGADLGARMADAFNRTLRDCPYAVIIGTDCPTLTQYDLSEALTALKQGHDAVIGPAEDGGYVLLGLRRFEAALFENIAWGSADVLDITRTRLTQLQWRWHELPTRWDVDRPEDMERLLRTGILEEQ